MSKKGKRMSGEGWSFIPADAKKESAPVTSLSPNQQSIRVRIEKRAKGKTVTVASGFALTQADLKDLCKTMKKKIGSGGSSAEDQIEIQGEHAEAVSATLQSLGYRIK